MAFKDRAGRAARSEGLRLLTPPATSTATRIETVAFWCAAAWCVARVVIYPPLSGDDAWQMAAGRGLWSVGRLGWTLPFVDAVPKMFFEPMYQWAPGLALLAAAFQPLGWLPETLACVLSLSGAGLFFSGWRRIFETIRPDFPAWTPAAVYAAWVVLVDPFFYTGAGESLALGAYAFGLSMVLRRGDGGAAAGDVALGILFGLCGWLRYAYWPLAFVPPLALAAGLRTRASRRSAARIAAATAVVLIGAAALLKWNRGTVAFLYNYYGNVASSPQWHQLAEMIPFLAAALGLERAPEALERLLPGADAAGVLWPVFAALAAVFAGAFRFRLAEAPGAGRWRMFALMAWGTAGFTVALLVALSLRFDVSAFDFVFVEETRYYAPVLPFVTLAVFMTVAGRPGTRTARALRITACVVLVLAAAHIPIRRTRAGGVAPLVGAPRRDGGEADRTALRAASRLHAGEEPLVYLEDQRIPAMWYRRGYAQALGLPAPIWYAPGTRLHVLAPVTILAGVGRVEDGVNGQLRAAALACGRQVGASPESDLFLVSLAAVNDPPDAYACLAAAADGDPR